MANPLVVPITAYLQTHPDPRHPKEKDWAAVAGAKLVAAGYKTAADILPLDHPEKLVEKGVDEQTADAVMHTIEKAYITMFDEANDFEEYTVKFTKSPLGLTFKGFQTEAHDKSELVAVSDCLGQAAASGKIKVLDQLVTANGIPLVTCGFDEAMQTLQRLEFPYEIGFRRVADHDGRPAVARGVSTAAVGGSVVSADPAAKQMDGWLEKQGHINKTWQKRWFVLQNRCLYYYTAEPEKGGKRKGVISLEGSTIYSLQDSVNPHCFTVQSVTGGKVKAYPIKASSDLMRECWVDLIRLHGTDASMAGWVTKKGHVFPTWKKRWTVLEGSTIYYFTSPSGELKGTINLNGAKIDPSKDKTKFTIKTDDSQNNFDMQVATERERDTWVQKCADAIASGGEGSTPFDGDSHDSIASSSPASIAAPVEQAKKTAALLRTQSSKGARLETGAATFQLNAKEPVSLKDFNLLKVVGRGAFGKVMMAQKKAGENANAIYAIKVLIKSDVVAKKQVENTIAERNILIQMSHPYIVCLRYSFESKDKLYLVTDYYNGGAMFYHVRKNRGFDEDRTKFYAAELMLAIDHLHDHGIIYRDMKLENILMDHRGHIALTDFGLSKQNLSEVFAEEQNTFCGTAEYIAPELIRGVPYSAAVDWWSFGILVFEMKNVKTPFYDKNRKVIITEYPGGTTHSLCVLLSPYNAACLFLTRAFLLSFCLLVRAHSRSCGTALSICTPTSRKAFLRRCKTF